jgi:hypothetical protein
MADVIDLTDSVGPGSRTDSHRPAPAPQPAASPEAASQGGEGGAFRCKVCFDSMLDGRELAAATCGHVFCAACLRQAVRQRGECPFCRQAAQQVTRLFFD